MMSNEKTPEELHEEFIGALAMMEVERSEPKLVSELDELHNKEKSGVITSQEVWRLKTLDNQLSRVLQRMTLHWATTWRVGLPESRQIELRTAVAAWQAKMKGDVTSAADTHS